MSHCSCLLTAERYTLGEGKPERGRTSHYHFCPPRSEDMLTMDHRIIYCEEDPDRVQTIEFED